jgi:hypothetical protein
LSACQGDDRAEILQSPKLTLFNAQVGRVAWEDQGVKVVPFLVALTLLMRPAVGYLSLLWPLLYGLHALLLLAGVPLRFAEPWGFLDILVPISGYGMLTGLIAHAYSRIALYRLRRLTRVPVQPEGEVECHD